MAVRINNLRIPVEQPESELPRRIARRLRLPETEIVRWRILRKSLDARSRNDLKFVYSAIVEIQDESACLSHLATRRDTTHYEPNLFDDPHSGSQPIGSRPVVVGAGPAGLLAAYYLARRGYCPLIIERGQPVKDRVPVLRAFDRREANHQSENNYLFGEGGAGAFSDGKLTCRMSGADVDWVLRAIVECGGRPSIVYEHRPHLGSNKLPMICRNFRRKIEAWGGEYKFGCRLERLEVRDSAVSGLHTSSGFIAATHVILGIGHSARDTYEMLHAAGVPFRQKAFQLGLRIEQPQAQVDAWKYGRDRYRDLLGAADYSLVVRGQRDLYSFCMCAGGVAIPSISEPNRFCTNGMSSSRHETPFANSGLMITLQPDEFGSPHPLAGVELQRRYESAAFELGRGDYLSPIQWARDFVDSRPSSGSQLIPSSYRRGTLIADLQAVLPPAVIQVIRNGLPILDKRWKGRFLDNATLIGPEMRGSSPVRIDRDPTTRQVPGLPGLYPVGEGAGYAGGIVSAAVDGLRSAREIVRHYAPLAIAAIP